MAKATYQVVITEEAQKDIDGILEYLLEEESYKKAIDT
jgi:plasmid stabilization system protein ParE